MTRLQWLVYASQFPGRYTLLATSLGPHLSHICTNEHARSLVLRITHQGYDLEAVRIMVNGFHQAAPNILDQVYGRDFMLRVLASPNIDPAQKRALDRHASAILARRIQVRDICLALQQTQTNHQQQLPPLSASPNIDPEQKRALDEREAAVTALLRLAPRPYQQLPPLSVGGHPH
jgi:hypothetical protein